jgi:hypothetical protein
VKRLGELRDDAWCYHPASFGVLAVNVPRDGRLQRLTISGLRHDYRPMHFTS